MDPQYLNMQTPQGARALEIAGALISATLEVGPAHRLLGSYELTEAMREFERTPTLQPMTLYALASVATVILLNAAEVVPLEPREILALVVKSLHETMIVEGPVDPDEGPPAP
jgi:hypothetical protein